MCMGHMCNQLEYDMGKAFKSFFSVLEQLFGALQHAVSALAYLCRWAEETAGSFYDESRTERLNRQKAAEQNLLSAPEQA